MIADGTSPPRLIYYSDAHHFHAKRIDPPLNLHKMRWPIDELSGTGVDLLAFGLGFGDVYFHQTKIGRVIGQEQEVWNDFINWRIMRMVEDAQALGTDQVREVIKHGRAAGMGVFPSLKLQDPSPQGDERCGWLKWRNGMQVALGTGDDRFPNHQTEWCYDYANEAVRREKLSLIGEMLEEYKADGIELDFMFFPLYFRRAETEANIPTMNHFVAQVRALAREIGERQSRSISIMARVWQRREDNLGIGLDVESWIAEGNIDLVVGQIPHLLLDTGVTDGKWLADAANAADMPSYLRPGRRLDDPRADIASIEMFRAFGQTLHWQGFTGACLGYLPWPLAQAEYQILREMAVPEAVLRRDKRYFLPPRENLVTYVQPDTRQLPLILEEGVKRTVSICVADEVESARADDEMREPMLTLTIQFFCVEDDVSINFNGKDLAIDRKVIREPRRGLYWLRWTLATEDVEQGDNTLEIEIVRKEKTAGFARTLTGVEVHMRYAEFDRPESLDSVKIPPPA